MRTKALAPIGLLLAVLAEACSVGLLGLSGWFIAASAVAGASASSAFSYLAPSGGVRALALGRIATGYANRVVLHAAALRRISAARLAVYDQAAGSEGGGWSGESLDRVMADADTTGMALIQATTPVVVGAAMTAGGCVAIVLAGYPLVALVLALAVIACAVLAATAARRMDDTGRTRRLLRTELVTAVAAWPEMASLGATDQLAHRTLCRLAPFEGRRNRHLAITAAALGGARAMTAIALVLTVLVTARAGGSVATSVFVALLAAGVMANAERLVSAATAWVQSRQADAHLASVGEEERRRPEVAESFHAEYDGHGLAVSGYQLPETPTRDAREIGFGVAASQTLVITGPSGSGKTTLIAAIATALRRTPVRPSSPPYWPTTICSPGRLPTTFAWPTPPGTTPKSRTCSPPWRWTAPEWNRRPASASAAAVCPVARSADSTSPAPSPPNPTYYSSTSRQPAWTRTPPDRSCTPYGAGYPRRSWSWRCTSRPQTRDLSASLHHCVSRMSMAAQYLRRPHLPSWGWRSPVRLAARSRRQR